jgi:3-hydroxyisobutyrate dehydrogenase-like beta-hydroxyacid dehydrogenase
MPAALVWLSLPLQPSCRPARLLFELRLQSLAVLVETDHFIGHGGVEQPFLDCVPWTISKFRNRHEMGLARDASGGRIRAAARLAASCHRGWAIRGFSQIGAAYISRTASETGGTRMFRSVGLVGVGAMGQALLQRLVLAGVKVRAYDISEESMAAARELGAETVESAAEASRGVEAVHLFVRTDQEEIESATGPGGLLEGAAPGTILLLHSTVLPETTRRVAAAAAKTKVDVVDAPVTSVPRQVGAGEGVFLVGGDPDVVARVRPHLEALGKHLYYFGPLGAGNIAKIAKNSINAMERVMLAEVLAVVEAGGLDLNDFMEMSVLTDQGSTVARWKRAFSIDRNHASPRPASNVLNKDIGHAADLADSLGVRAPITRSSADMAKVWVASWETPN